jgi:hypothetical protein
MISHAATKHMVRKLTVPSAPVGVDAGVKKERENISHLVIIIINTTKKQHQL